MVLVKKGSITPHTQFEGEVYVLKKEEGGRHTPFFAGYRPQFYIRTTDVTGQITAFTSDDGSNVEMVMPGDRIKMTGELICPVAIEQVSDSQSVKVAVLLELELFLKFSNNKFEIRNLTSIT